MSKKRCLTSLEFSRLYKEFDDLIDETTSRITRLNEKIIFFTEERDFYLKRKADLLLKLEKLING